MWVGGNTDTFSEKRFRDRIRQMSVLFATGFVVVALRLFHLQVVRGSEFSQMSEINRTQAIFLKAPRGDFMDSQGRVFVRNRPSWSLVYSVPEKSKVTKQEVESQLGPYLAGVSPAWMKRLGKAFDSRQLVRLVEDIPDPLAFVIREMEGLFPGVRVVMEFRRGYPRGVFAEHLIGYLGEIGERELRDDPTGNRKSGDFVGKMGLEKIQDDVLRGQDGGMLIEVDSVGRLKRVIRELPFQKGASVHLTLNLDVQQVAEEELGKTSTGRGAAVAIDVNTGAILAWASAPAFDPQRSMAEGLKDPRSPFLDRVYKGAYPPGSTFKIITAIAGFEQEAIRTSAQVECRGFLTLVDKRGGERKYRCWKTHGMVDYWRAMAESCDVYFYQLGERLGSQAIYDTAYKFGFGQTVQDLLPAEVKGNIPNPLWKKRVGLGGWSTGDTYNMAIGQGFVTATPLQVAVLMMGLARHGSLQRPYVVQKIASEEGKSQSQADPRSWKTVTLKDSTWDIIQRSLRGVVLSGTGGASRIEHLDVYGKTGTAQNPHGDHHAWFAGYAGYKGQPSTVAVCVFIENGGHGGSVAAPIVRRMLETALPPIPPPLAAEPVS